MKYPDQRYSDYCDIRECAAEIAKQCVLEGKSGGWSGNEEDFEAVSNILNSLNIVYVDDFYGIWRMAKPKTNTN